MATTRNNQDDFDSDEWGNIQLPGFGDDKLMDPKLNVKLALLESQEKRTKRFQDPDVKQKKSNSLKESWADPEIYIKRVISNTKSRTDDVRKRISKGLIGIKRDPRTEYHKQKLSDALKGIPKPKMICPHCKTEGAGPVMKRFHFDNCKHK